MKKLFLKEKNRGEGVDIVLSLFSSRRTLGSLLNSEPWFSGKVNKDKTI
jgi:hypothetical protein